MTPDDYKTIIVDAKLNRQLYMGGKCPGIPNCRGNTLRIFRWTSCYFTCCIGHFPVFAGATGYTEITSYDHYLQDSNKL